MKIKRFLPLIVLTAAGAVCGYLYAVLVGCQTGTCPISSNPGISTLYCAGIGALVGLILTPGGRKRDKNKEDSHE